MGKETVSLKLDTEIAEEFRKMQKEHKSAQEFAEILLNDHKQRQIETDTDSPVRKEKIKVKKALADVERVVSSFLEIAADEKERAIKNAEIEKKAAAKKNTDLEKKIDEQNTTIANLEKKNQDLKKSAEMFSELKTAWQKLEKNWKNEKENLLAQNENLIAQIRKREEKK